MVRFRNGSGSGSGSGLCFNAPGVFVTKGHSHVLEPLAKQINGLLGNTKVAVSIKCFLLEWRALCAHEVNVRIGGVEINPRL